MGRVLLPDRMPGSHRLRRIGLLAIVVVLVAATAVVIWQQTHQAGLAEQAVATASSTREGSSVRGPLEAGAEAGAGGDWQSDGQTAGAWYEVAWDQPHELRHIVLVRNPLEQPGATAGFLSFGDGSYLQIALSDTTRETDISFSPRTVSRVRFTVSAVSPGAQNVTLSEIQVNNVNITDAVVSDDTSDGNEAAVAAATTSVGGSDAHALQDGSGSAGAAGIGSEWTVNQPAGAWIQLNWDRPREIASVELMGSTRSVSSVGSATLTFGDGSKLPVGGVVSTPDQPTIMSFMPRVTRSVRITIDHATGTGPLTLSELRVYQRGSTPVRSSASGAAAPPATGAQACPASTGGSTQASGLLIQCPVTGSTVDGKFNLQVAVPPGYFDVAATVLPADQSIPAAAVVKAQADQSGAATLPMDAGNMPAGPFTVKVEGSGAGVVPLTSYLQLYRPGGSSDDGEPSSAPSNGRTLSYDEEFGAPITTSPTGAGAEYASSKPTATGSEGFGDAAFADPSQGFGNMRVVDNRYLRIDVKPTPAAAAQSIGHAHIGGLLASARQGGSGFSAQYGYFEARMLIPAAPGTWPAFWMLPSDNLAAPTPSVAEIDALEAYGVHPLDACHSTHQYTSGNEDAGVSRCGQRFTSDRDALSWHTYGVSITPTDITYYIDGRVVATAPQVHGGGSPMFFMVNLALGGGWPIDLAAVQDRATLYVDYVRVYV